MCLCISIRGNQSCDNRCKWKGDLRHWKAMKFTEKYAAGTVRELLFFYFNYQNKNSSINTWAIGLKTYSPRSFGFLCAQPLLELRDNGVLKNLILALKPQSRVRIFIYRKWPIVFDVYLQLPSSASIQNNSWYTCDDFELDERSY